MVAAMKDTKSVDHLNICLEALGQAKQPEIIPHTVSSAMMPEIQEVNATERTISTLTEYPGGKGILWHWWCDE